MMQHTSACLSQAACYVHVMGMLCDTPCPPPLSPVYSIPTAKITIVFSIPDHAHLGSVRAIHIPHVMPFQIAPARATSPKSAESKESTPTNAHHRNPA